jgi:hypothetical protein
MEKNPPNYFFRGGKKCNNERLDEMRLVQPRENTSAAGSLSLKTQSRKNQAQIQNSHLQNEFYCNSFSQDVRI